MKHYRSSDLIYLKIMFDLQMFGHSLVYFYCCCCCCCYYYYYYYYYSGFYNPLVGFSLLILEVSRSHTMTRHSR
jgi:hypothetical protein